MNRRNSFVLIALCFLLQAIPSMLFGKPPAVRIRVAQYPKKIEFIMPRGGSWQSNGKSGKLRANQPYQIEGLLQAMSQRRFHLMVGSGSSLDEAQLVEIENRFKQYRTHRFTAGELPAAGYPDNRVVFIGVGVFVQEEEARLLQDKLSSQNISSWVFIENIRPSKGKLLLKQGNKTIFETVSAIELLANSHTILKKVEFAKGYSWHGFEDRKYAGKLQIQFGTENVIDCIEHTDLEKLLIGIVPSEISARAPTGALQAQAVAARGEMLSKKGVRHLHEGYDFCSEQHCQVYKGIQNTDKAIGAAIKPTRGLVLKSHSGRIVDAVYGANCGGHSSANHNIWTSNPDPHLQGVSDLIKPASIDLTDEKQATAFILRPPDCWCAVSGIEGADKFRWKKTLTAKDWEAVEKKAAIGRIKDVGEFVREVSGRIVNMKLSGERGTKSVLKELPIRQMFGGLRSSFFKVAWKRDHSGFINGAEFEGAGWGHGVGMCQTGAQSMAAAGWNFSEILFHYFPGAKLIKLY